MIANLSANMNKKLIAFGEQLKIFKFIENATIHVFFWGVILAVFLPQGIDKTGIVFYGLVGLVYRLGKPFRKEVDSLLIFVIYLMAVALSYSLYKSFLVTILFLLQFGVIYYFIITISKRGPELIYRWLNTIVRYSAFFILIGLVDLIFYYSGIVTFIHAGRQHNPWAISSFYLNPNHLGAISGVLFGFVLLSGVAIRARKLYLFILVLGTIISDSTMGMLLVPASYMLKHIPLRPMVIMAVILVAFLTVGSIAWAEAGEFLELLKKALNYRLEIWSAMLEQLFGDHRFFGIGTGTFQETVFLVRHDQPHSYGPHSMYLWLLVECGLVGSLIYAWFVFLQFNFLSDDKLMIGHQKILILLLLSQTTEVSIIHVEITQLLYCLVLGLIIQRKSVISQSVKNRNV